MVLGQKAVLRDVRGLLGRRMGVDKVSDLFATVSGQIPPHKALHREG